MALPIQRIFAPLRGALSGASRVLAPSRLVETARTARDDALEIAMRSALTWLSAMVVMNLLWYGVLHVLEHVN